jgi:hypothetical protein
VINSSIQMRRHSRHAGNGDGDGDGDGDEARGK